MIPEKLIAGISAQAKRTAQRKNLEQAGIAVKGGAAGGVEEQRALSGERNERPRLHLQLTKISRYARAFGDVYQLGREAFPTSGDRRIIQFVEDVAQADLAAAAVDPRQTLAANQRGQIALKNPISQTDLVPAAGVESNVESSTRALVAIQRDAAIVHKRIARSIEEKRVR